MIIRKSYNTDISERQWQLLEPHLLGAKTGGRKRTINLREVINAIFYLLRAGCAWRLLPHDFPKWQTVYGYLRQWQEDGTWVKLNRILKSSDGQFASQPVEKLIRALIAWIHNRSKKLGLGRKVVMTVEKK